MAFDGAANPIYEAPLTSTPVSSPAGSDVRVSGVWVAGELLKDLKGQPLRPPVVPRESLEDRSAVNRYEAFKRLGGAAQHCHRAKKSKQAASASGAASAAASGAASAAASAAASGAAAGRRSSAAASAAASGAAAGTRAASGAAAGSRSSGAVVWYVSA